MAAPQATVSCVGDSITAGNSYANMLGPLLGPGFNVTNQGVSGHTMLNSGLCDATPSGSWRRPCLERSTTQPCERSAQTSNSGLPSCCATASWYSLRNGVSRR